MRSKHAPLWLAFILILFAPPLRAQPPASVAPAGILRLGEGAIAFIPDRDAASAPAPLLVLLHGAHQSPGWMIDRFREEARRRGVILLAPRSEDVTWDMIVALSRRRDREPGSGSWRSRPHGDRERIGRAIDELIARAPVDRGRIGLAGFSDGASYALSLGFVDPPRFGFVLAFSPGMVDLPARMSKAPRTFLAHGRRDSILAYRNASLGIVPRLRREGLDVTFRPFDGDHEIPPAVEAEAFDFFLGNTVPVLSPRPSAPSRQ